ncbi:MAG: 2-C-methyl-D-erythritol 4-phosphate cytidylyltransferase [Deltaproteobacteria bacterium]|nr:2-C-methyl-D-erythritol 4-phosphate cytidylyltransferase [Deltaproteobacteria bacterium]MBW2417673.1 2-C-methyl-D-erythritol 4-phosphate cytidylyltransferase [Deltaproteobacteria bacterium]
MKVVALILAAGRGARLSHSLPKAFVPLLGKALVVRSLEGLAAVPEIDGVIPVVAQSDMERFGALDLSHIPKLLPPVVGGAERQDSVAAGLASLGEEVEMVAVHDAARCLVGRDEVSRVIAAAREMGAAILAQPVRDTIKRVRSGVVLGTPPREECWAAQTPQVFRVEILRDAMAKARAEGRIGTDDAQLVEQLGLPVRIVEGGPRNFKITLPEDLALAELWLRSEEAEAMSEEKQ